MAKISKGDLEIAQEWVAFFDRLGWDFYDLDTESGIARRDTGSRRTGRDGKSKPELKSITTGERHDIEATWREQDKPVLKDVSNG